MTRLSLSLILCGQALVFVQALCRHKTRWSACPSQAVQPTHEADGGITYEADPDFLEHVHREACRQGELPWDD